MVGMHPTKAIIETVTDAYHLSHQYNKPSNHSRINTKAAGRRLLDAV